ncbi:complement resistance protein TraT [Catenovulum sp. 2E275]|uniref:complement resistance protein TraT n=1 Tax=Catenovulum sp. 2E275 TaxID=2980497 RepID=UPI0021CE5469|nr:complement resistance protein TraT [Catenovulum sp. 2E275]MCU4676640.1 complement resistance protein TraT [Catenovulum sp. 2E275]
MTKLIRSALILFSGLLILSGCSSITTASKKQDLSINSRLTQTIFLDPVAPELMTIYLQVRNNSDSENFYLSPGIKQRLENNGYQIVNDPTKATYWLQANVRYVGRPEGNEFEDAIGNYKGAAEGAVTAVTISELGGGSGSDNVKAAAIGALIGYIADAAVSDDYYTAITDVQIAKKVDEGMVISDEEHRLNQGESGQAVQSSQTTSDRQKYQTKVLITANQANMDVVKAEAEIAEKLTRVLAGLF